jgi:hypothetical protein
MIAIAEQAGRIQGGLSAQEPTGSALSTQSWQDIVTNLAESRGGHPLGGLSRPESLSQLTGLLRMQMEVCRYQLKVEVVSKVAESAVASMRKLQQPQ